MRDLFEAWALAHDAGEARKLWVHRSTCDRRCWTIGAWEVRGRIIVAARGIRLPVSMRTVPDLVEKVPGRAWLAADVPSEPIMIGCRHQMATSVMVSTEPRVTSDV